MVAVVVLDDNGRMHGEENGTRALAFAKFLGRTPITARSRDN